MIQHVVDRCRAVPGLDRVVVATDDERIAAAAREAGAEAFETSGDYRSGTDRVAAAADGLSASIVVNVQGDEALIDPVALGGALGRFEEDGSELGTLRAPLGDPADLYDPDVVKVVVDDSGRALYFSRGPVPFPRHLVRRDDPGASADGRRRLVFDGAPGADGPWSVHVGVYLYRRDALRRWAAMPPSALERHEGLEQLRPLAAGESIQTYEIAEAAPAINRPSDLERAEAWLSARTPSSTSG